MQNLVNEAPAKKNYDFIDTIRCIAMIFIIMEHSTYFEPNVYLPTHGVRAFLFYLSIQFSKFGTVCFFLLAGFLIGDKFTDYTPLQYLKRRVNSTIWPWIFWSLFYIVMTNFDIIINKIIGKPDPQGINVYQTLWDSVRITYLYTNYWFIPNFLFCITLLLMFKRYLYSYIFGSVLFCFTLFYSVNIYLNWIPTSHTIAILGFVFFLWLGAQFNKNWSAVNAWINKTPLLLWVALTIVTLYLSLVEMGILRSIGNTDPYNTLRFSNVIYSMCFFFMLLKIRDFNFIRFLKPRETTYGMYLIHYVVLWYLLANVYFPLKIDVNSLSVIEVLALQLAKFLAVYSVTYFIVWVTNKTKFKWLVGR